MKIRLTKMTSKGPRPVNLRLMLPSRSQLNALLFGFCMLLSFGIPLKAQPLSLEFQLSSYQSARPNDWAEVNEASALIVNNSLEKSIQGTVVFSVFHEGELLLSTDMERVNFSKIGPGEQSMNRTPIASLWNDLRVENYQNLGKLIRRNGKLKPNKRCFICAAVVDGEGNQLSNEDCEWMEIPAQILPPQIIYPLWGNTVAAEELELQVAPSFPISDYCIVQIYKKDPKLSVKETVQKRKPFFQDRIRTSGTYSIPSDAVRWSQDSGEEDLIITVTSVDPSTWKIGTQPSRLVSFQWQNPDM